MTPALRTWRGIRITSSPVLVRGIHINRLTSQKPAIKAHSTTDTMFSWSSLSAGLLPRMLRASSSTASSIDIPLPTTYDINDDSDKRARTVNSLLKANHLNHSVLYHNNIYHNHVPHILGSSYILGSTDAQLKTIYDSSSTGLEAWKPAPGEITRDDWREYLGKTEYQRAYLDHFEDRLAGLGYDWKALVDEVYTTGDQPLVHNAMSGCKCVLACHGNISRLTSPVGHGIIHLGYAYELNSRTVATEALTMAACVYDSKHKYLDDPAYTRPAPNPTESLFDLITRAHDDDRLGKAFSNPAPDLELLDISPDQESLLLEYWNSWTITDPKSAFAQIQRLGAGLLVASSPPGGHDFFIVHLLTSSHALRVLLPFFDSKHDVPLLRQWWLFVISTYIVRDRPGMNWKLITAYDPQGRGWTDVVHAAVQGEHALDEHFVKACRALRDAAAVWGDGDEWFLRAAVRFVDEFRGWKHD